jgi:drug/metabolite transporter (DMT)-like permease
MVATLNIVGLILALAGVLLLFRYGMPFQTRTGGVRLFQFEAGNSRDQNQIKLERRYDRLGWLGLVLIVVGTVCQIIANLV